MPTIPSIDAQLSTMSKATRGEVIRTLAHWLAAAEPPTWQWNWWIWPTDPDSNPTLPSNRIIRSGSKQ